MRQKTNSRICRICGKNVTKGYEHHYLTKGLDESKRIFVCPRCHQLDHQTLNRLLQEVESGNTQRPLFGNDPHADRRAAIKAARERIRNRRRLLP